jgi:hypothetical protein
MLASSDTVSGVILAVGLGGEGKGVTLNLIAGSELFNQSDSLRNENMQLSSYDVKFDGPQSSSSTVKLIKLPETTFVGSDINKLFATNISYFEQVYKLCDGLPLHILICRSALRTRLEMTER